MMQFSDTHLATVQSSSICASVHSSGVFTSSDSEIKVPNAHKPRKNSEKRKAKSRDAARVRRSTESGIFNDLCQLLPVPRDVSEQMDKISIIRLAVAFLKTKGVTETYFKRSSSYSGKIYSSDSHHSNNVNGGNHLSYLNDDVRKSRCMPFVDEASSLAFLSLDESNGAPSPVPKIESLLEAISGFVLIVSKDGFVVFASDSCEKVLGVGAIDLMGNNLFDIIHMCDHEDLQTLLQAPVAIAMDDTVTSSSCAGTTYEHSSSEMCQTMYNCKQQQQHMPSANSNIYTRGPLNSLPYTHDNTLSSSSSSTSSASSSPHCTLAGVTDAQVFNETNYTDNDAYSAAAAAAGITEGQVPFTEGSTDETGSAHELPPSSDTVTHPFILLLRMKSKLSTRGKSVTVKQSNFKSMKLTGKKLSNGTLCALVEPFETLPWKMGSQGFVCQHSLDMKFTQVEQNDDQVETRILGYHENDLLGSSFYQYVHACDSSMLLQCLKNVYHKGQSESEQPYRFIGKFGGYCWLLSRFTLIRDSHSQPKSIISVNYFVSELVLPSHIISTIQIHQEPVEARTVQQQQEQQQQRQEQQAPGKQQQQQQSQSQEYSQVAADRYPCQAANLLSPASAVTKTDSVFAPRTKDMSSGLLILTGDENSPLVTILDDSAASDPAHDLTHLAPESGDNSDFPLELDSLPSFEGYDMDDLLQDIDMNHPDNCLTSVCDEPFALSSSSVLDSPISFSNSTCLNSDLDMYPDEFSHALLSEDPLWDSSIDSSLHDIMSSSDIYYGTDSNAENGDSSSFSSSSNVLPSISKPRPTLPHNSSLAQLLQQQQQQQQQQQSSSLSSSSSLSCSSSLSPLSTLSSPSSSCSSPPTASTTTKGTAAAAAAAGTTTHVMSSIYNNTTATNSSNSNHKSSTPCTSSSSSFSGPTAKRFKSNSSAKNQQQQQQRKLQQQQQQQNQFNHSAHSEKLPSPEGSVLKNLLLNGEDVTNGYGRHSASGDIKSKANSSGASNANSSLFTWLLLFT